MGIIKATAEAVKGTLSDSWLEVYEADNMDDQTLFTRFLFWAVYSGYRST